MAHAGSGQAALVAVTNARQIIGGLVDRPAKSRARPFRSSGALELEISPAGLRRLNLAKQLAANASEISYAALRLLPPIIMGNLNVMYALPLDTVRRASSDQVAFATWYLYWTPCGLELCLQ